MTGDGAYSLLFDNDIELYGGGEDVYWFSALAEGTSWGEPQPVEVAVASLLRDGQLVESTGNGNREVTLRVTVHSTDPVGLAEGRARLDRATGKRTTLVWRDSDYPATVFDVETSAVVAPGGFDDLEYKRNELTVGLRLVCLPFTRSLEPVVDDAGTPPSDAGTLLSNLESTTGWAQYQSPFGVGGAIGTEYTVSGSVFFEGAGSLRAKPYYAYTEYGYPTVLFGWADQVTGWSYSTGTGGYLSIRLKGSHADLTVDSLIMTTVENGAETVSPFAAERSADGWVRYVWPVDGSLTVTGLKFSLFMQYPRASQSDNGTDIYAYYDDFRVVASATTDKQIVKQLTVEGSARTTGSLLVAAPDDAVALGEVMVVTAPTASIPAGYTPDARRWVAVGSSTADANAPHGSYYSPNGAYGVGGAAFDVPASMFTPGPYVAVLAASRTAGEIEWRIRAGLTVAGTQVGEFSEVGQNIASYTADVYHLMPMGVLYLPPVPVLSPDSTVKVRFEFYGNGGGAMRIDDLYLIPAWAVGGRAVADYSIIDCGTGTVGVGEASSHLWLDSPSAAQPQGGYWRGPDASKQLAVSAWPDAVKPGPHVFEPGDLTAFVVSTAAQGPRVELTYFPSWHGSAAS